ncbi:hypothetical protein [Melittangium boletus]|uniref:hypothetical protein n=1 Tax=Melittangium boletus TaxID=83453 RepID=UPI003DA37579
MSTSGNLPLAGDVRRRNSKMEKMSFEQFEQLVQYLSHLRGEAHNAFRESVIFNLQERGYSAVRASQVVDEFERRALLHA